MAKKSSTTIEDNLQALIGLRYFTQEVMERDSDVPIGDTLEYVDKKIAALIAEKYSDEKKTKKAAVKKEPTKKAAVKKAAVKKEPARKEAPAKKQTKKVAAKKEPVKKVAAKKEAVKKAPAKKAPAKKAKAKK
jgi:hypothetical protein